MKMRTVANSRYLLRPASFLALVVVAVVMAMQDPPVPLVAHLLQTVLIAIMASVMVALFL